MIGFRLIVRVILLMMVVLTFYQASAVKSASQESRPESFGDILRQAQAKMNTQQWAESAALWERVVEVNPHNGNYWRKLADTHYRAKNYRKAIPAYEKALELGEGLRANSAYNIACCHALAGEREKALDWLERALDMRYRNLGHMQTDDDLKSLHADERFKTLAAIVDPGKMTRDEGWRFDLNLLAREIKRIHYNPYRKVTKEQFDAYVKDLHARIPGLSDQQILVGFMKLTAMAGDGHTRIRPAQRMGVPVEFYLFTEGMFIISVLPPQTDIIAAQVLAFGDRPVDEVMKALDPLISRDNDIWSKVMGPDLMRYPQVLNGLGLIPAADKMDLKIRDSQGQVRLITLSAGPANPNPFWADGRKKGERQDPLYLKNRMAAYWFEYLPESKTVYFQYNQVRNDVKDPLPQFCDRLFKFINENDVEKLVIDMRWNGGGNNFLNQPITHGLIRCDKINRRGNLFVIVGRDTFSAAMCGAAHIERNTNAIFVGEPTGSSPNFIGETNRVSLPYSRVQASISDLYWQNSVAMDYRTWIAPELYAPPSFELYRENRDPALEAILSYDKVN